MNIKKLLTKSGALFAVMALLSLAACNSAKKKTGNEKDTIKEGSWNLISLAGTPVAELGETDRKVSFKLAADQDRVNGFSGCNTFMGQYHLDKNQTLQFSGLASTRMACPDNSFNENEFLKILEKTASYNLEKGQLSLLDDAGKTLAVFEKSTKDSKITEKYWKLINLDGVSVEMAENQQKEQHFILKEKENKLQGFGGCNNFMGQYTLKRENQIEFSQIAATLKACPNVDINEADFLKIFERAKTYTLNDGELSLKDEDGNPLALFKAVYFD